MVLIITIVKVAKKADEIITRIGLNPAITGDRGKGVGSVLAYTVLRSAASKVVKTIGAAATGGASAATGAVAGGIGAAAGATGAVGTAGAAGASGVAGAAFRSNTQRETTRQSSTTQEQKTESVSSGGVGDPAKGTASQTPRRDGPSRQSSVPSGARRAASYVSGGEGKSGPASSGGRTVGGFGGGAGRSVRTSGGSFGRGGGFSGGAGRDTLKGPGRNGAGRLRPVTVLADDFDDGGETDTRGDLIRRPSMGTSAGGAGRSGSPGPAGTAPSAETSTNRAASGKRVETTIKGVSDQKHQQSDSRSTRRGKAAKPPAEATAVHSGGKHIPGPAGTGDGSSTRTTSARKQSASRTARQGRPDDANGIVQKGGGPIIRPGPAGTGSGSITQTADKAKQRGSSPARQKRGKPPMPPGQPVKGDGPTVRPGSAGTVKGQADQTRTTKAPPGAPGIGGPEHGKPR